MKLQFLWLIPLQVLTGLFLDLVTSTGPFLMDLQLLKAPSLSNEDRDIRLRQGRQTLRH